MEHWNRAGAACQPGTPPPQSRDQSAAHDAFKSPCEADHEKQLGVFGSLPGDTFAINCRMTNNVGFHTPFPQPEVKLNIYLVDKCSRDLQFNDVWLGVKWIQRCWQYLSTEVSDSFRNFLERDFSCDKLQPVVWIIYSQSGSEQSMRPGFPQSMFH